MLWKSKNNSCLFHKNIFNPGQSMQKFFLLLLNSSLLLSAAGQGVYFNTADKIYELNAGAGNCSYTEVNCPCAVSPYSLACHKDTMYVLETNGNLSRFKIGVPGSCQFLTNAGLVNSLTVDKDGIVYLADNRLFRYNPYTNVLDNLGTMPCNSAGDLTFFKGKLLLAGVPSGIYELNLTNPSSSTLYMNTGNLFFYGLVSFSVPCSNSRYFGFAPQTGNTAMVEIDLINKAVLGQACLLPANIGDAASTTEDGLTGDVNLDNYSLTQPCLPATTGTMQMNAYFPFPGNLTYVMDNNTTNNTGYFPNLSPGTHSLVVNAPGNLCNSSVTFEVIPRVCDLFFIPNSFSPNGDGHNDLFRPAYTSILKNINLTIYNRYGQQVYSGKGNNSSWNGMFRQSAQPAGSYVYVLKYTDYSGADKVRKGNILLIR